MSRPRGAYHDQMATSAMGAPSSYSRLAGALETGELEKRRKKRRRKFCIWVAWMGLLSGWLSMVALPLAGWCLFTASLHTWQPAAPVLLLIGTQSAATAGVNLLDSEQQPPAYMGAQPGEYGDDVGDTQDDYSDFGTYIIFRRPGNPDQASSDTDLYSDSTQASMEASGSNLNSGSLPTDGEPSSQVLFYAAAKSRMRPLGLGDASNSSPADRDQLSGHDNANNHDLDEPPRSAPVAAAAAVPAPVDKFRASPPIRGRREHLEPAGAGPSNAGRAPVHDELEDEDTKWLSKMNERLSALPAPRDYQARLLKVESDGNANMSAASLPVWPTGDTDDNTTLAITPPAPGATGHSIYYWRLIWFILPLGATFGNLLVIMAVYLERSLQSVTNYFIVSLAFADLFVGLIVMPFAVYVLVNGVWELGDATCDIFVAVDVTCSTASILNLVAISIDRYRAVAHPIAYSARSSSRRALFTILVAWFISCCVGAPVILGLNTTPERKSTPCILYNSTFIFWSSLTSFYVPCIIMLGLYWRIFLAIRSRTKKAMRAGGAGAPLARSSGSHKQAVLGAHKGSHWANQRSCPMSAPAAAANTSTPASGLSCKPADQPGADRSITAMSGNSKVPGSSRQVAEDEQLALDRLRALLVASQDRSLAANLNSSKILFALEQIEFHSCGCSSQAKSAPDDGDTMAVNGPEPEIDLAHSEATSGLGDTSRRSPIICCQSRFISKLSGMEILNISPSWLGSSQPLIELELELALSLALLGLTGRPTSKDRQCVGSRFSGCLAWSTGETQFWFEMSGLQDDSCHDSRASPDIRNRGAYSAIQTPTFRSEEVCRPNSDKIDVPSLGFKMMLDADKLDRNNGRLLLPLVCSSRQAGVGSELAGPIGGQERTRLADDKDDTSQQSATPCACCGALRGPWPAIFAGTGMTPSLVALMEPCGPQVARVSVLGQPNEPAPQACEVLFAYIGEEASDGLQQVARVLALWTKSRGGELRANELSGRYVNMTEHLCETCNSECLFGIVKSFEPHLAGRPTNDIGENNRLETNSRQHTHSSRLSSSRKHRKGKGISCDKSRRDSAECNHLTQLLREERQSTIARLASMSISVAAQTLPISADKHEYIDGANNRQRSSAPGAATFVKAGKLEQGIASGKRQRASSCGAASQESLWLGSGRRASIASVSSTTSSLRSSSGEIRLSEGSSMSRSSSSVETSVPLEIEGKPSKSGPYCCKDTVPPPSDLALGAATRLHDGSGRQRAHPESQHLQSKLLNNSASGLVCRRGENEVRGQHVSQAIISDEPGLQLTTRQSDSSFRNATRGFKRQSSRLSRLIRGKREEVCQQSALEDKVNKRTSQDAHEEDVKSCAKSTVISTSQCSPYVDSTGDYASLARENELSFAGATATDRKPATSSTISAKREAAEAAAAAATKVSDASRTRLQANLLLSAVAVVAQKPMLRICKAGGQSPLSHSAHLANNHLTLHSSEGRSYRAGSRRRREKNAARRERKATKTLAIVLGIFLICWTPFFTCNIIDGICIQLSIDCRPGMMVNLVTSWLGYINSCVNPIIYTIFNMEFRRAFKKILSTSFGCCWPYR